MKNPAKRILAALAALLLLPVMFLPAAADGGSLDTYIEQTAGYVLTAVDAPVTGTVGGEWAVIGLARSGADVPEDYYGQYVSRLEQYVKSLDGVLSQRKYTEYSRVILALAALGRDARDVAGYDLTKPLADFDSTIRQGISGPVWALIALDSRDYPMAEGTATRQMYVDNILDRQLPGGGWSLAGKTPEADVTAMALQALANYRELEGVNDAIDAALAKLSEMQNDSGGFYAYGVDTCESSAQVLTALCTLGISLDDERFVKNGSSVLDSLLSFRVEGQGFAHFKGGSTDQMATEQALYAMAAAQRSERGLNNLYDMSDVPAETLSGIELCIHKAVLFAGREVRLYKFLCPCLLLKPLQGTVIAK